MISCFECNSVECNSSEKYKMNEIINKLLLAGDKIMPEMHLKQPGFIVLVDHLLKIKKEFKNLKKQKIRDIFTEVNWIKPAFDIIWIMEILKT